MSIEQKLKDMNIDLPDFGGEAYYGMNYGKMKPYHRIGNILFLSGHVPDEDSDGNIIHPGALGDKVTIEQGYEAARITGLGCLAGIRQAVGSLDNVVGIVRSLNFVVCVPGFPDVHKVSDGLTDLLAEVFGPERGIGCRATIGVTALARNNCFETWLTAEVK